MDTNKNLITCHIDSTFLNNAENELFEILLTQHANMKKGFRLSKTRDRIVNSSRWVGFFLCTLGALISWATAIYLGWRPSSIQNTDNILIFSGLGIIFTLLIGVFFYLPTISSSLRNANPSWMQGLVNHSCRTLAKTCLKDAKKLAPFLAEYKLDGKSTTYFLSKDDSTKSIWSNELKGVAICGELATLFFKDWNSFQPTLLVLHENHETMRRILQSQAIEWISKSDRPN